MPMNSQPDNDDFMDFVEEDAAPKAEPLRKWRVAIIDDDEAVHEATRYALRDVQVFDCPIELLHFSSAEEARRHVDAFRDVAVAFVDVVMETPDAGLRLVRDLREAGLGDMRIVLRTGQPGYAPELSVVSKYEIDDYRTKSELTQTRLITVLTSCIRAYNQICMINRSRVGLEMIVDSSTTLFRRTNLELFSWGVLTQIAALLQVSPRGFVCVNSQAGDLLESRIVNAAGRFSDLLGKSCREIPDALALELLRKASSSERAVIEDGFFALRVSSPPDSELIALVETEGPLADTELALLELFSSNIAIAFDNLSLVERLDQLAFTDPHVNAPNLNAFDAALRQRIQAADKGFRLALVEIEAYHEILADYGIPVSQRFLRSVYGALSEASHPPMVARIGDGIFALLGDEANIRRDAITAAFETPFEVEEAEIVARPKSVIMDVDEKPASAVGVMCDAMSALTYAKQSRREACVHFDADMRREVGRRSRLQAALKQAVKHGDGLGVVVQPKVNLLTDECVGVEALLRWRHEDEQISPSEFVPLAEAIGLTQPLTDFVIGSVGEWYAKQNVDEAFSVAINLSMEDLNHPGFARRLLRQVKLAGLRPEAVEFEVTEGIAMKNRPVVVRQVGILRDAGHRISLDDFGTGYSSLSQFDHLPIDVLKIDRSFVNTLSTVSAKRSIAAVVLNMAEALNVQCVAEGIETEEQKQALLFLGCETGQGFLMGRPQPMSDFAIGAAGHSASLH